MIRVLIVDDHPALRAGVTTVLRSEPGFVPVAVAGDEEGLWARLGTADADVVLLDYHLPSTDGLVLCHRVKSRPDAPRVLIYSAYADASLAVPALLAGADGIVNKSASAHELFEAIRAVYRGDQVLPELSRELLDDATSEATREELPILGMLLNGTSTSDAAHALGTSEADLSRQVEHLIGRLGADLPRN